MRIYNSLSQQVDEVKSKSKKLIKIYVCGVTPYDTTHLGHAFVYVFFDTLIRFLRYSGYEVNYVQNVTDIDDDLLKRAKRDNRNWRQLGDFWTKRFLTDMKSLNVLPPTNYVRATQTIKEIIKIIENLIRKDFGYEREGNVYFDVEKFKDYGKLSRFTKNEMIALLKERGGDPTDKRKRHPLDFILWQKAKKDEPKWDSPWGLGRPGWHIECSAMVWKYLGEQIDIHGGGQDLIYPHHESEVAQSESFSGKIPYVAYWLHVAMLRYKGEKMSKSLGNLVLVRDLLEKYSANAIRYVLLSHHFRTPWEFHEEELEEAEKALVIIKGAMKIKSIKDNKINSNMEKFIYLMNSNIDTPEVLILILQMAKEIVKNKDTQNISTLKEIFLTLGFIL